MTGPSATTDDTVVALAAEVRDVLRRAGLRCVDETDATGGVRVDARSTVHIAWSAPKALKDDARAALKRQDTDDPAYRLFGATGEAMSTALLQIVEAAGFTASMFPETPYVVQVTA